MYTHIWCYTCSSIHIQKTKKHKFKCFEPHHPLQLLEQGPVSIVDLIHMHIYLIGVQTDARDSL
jgi:hypothetical protein